MQNLEQPAPGKNEITKEIIMAAIIEWRKEMDEVVELMQDAIIDPETAHIWADGKDPLPALKETLSLMQNQMEKLESQLRLVTKVRDLKTKENIDTEPQSVN